MMTHTQAAWLLMFAFSIWCGVLYCAMTFNAMLHELRKKAK